MADDFGTSCLKVVYLGCRSSSALRLDCPPISKLHPMQLRVSHILLIGISICYYGYKYFFVPQW